MDEIQTAIIECIEQTLAEIRRCNTTVCIYLAQFASLTLCMTWQIEAEELNVDNALFPSFGTLLRSQLDADWDRVSTRTKQMVGDLYTLRSLLK
jgi:DNA excision repair protein ERCC-4